MTDLSPSARATPLGHLWRTHRLWLISALILISVGIFSPEQSIDSAAFAVNALLHTAPYLLLSIAIAAWAGATGADNLIARAFTGSPVLMIALAALAGGLSPFCSCGVIPLIAALLSMGVPISAVMAFWLASPIMDPSMFVLTSGVLGFEFAVAKTLAAIGLGVLGGLVVLALARSGALTDPLREGIGNGGCGGAKLRAPKPVVWRFWEDPARRSKFGTEALKTTLFLAKWLTLAFLLESLMLAFVPAETVAGWRWAGADWPGDPRRRAGLSERLCRASADWRTDRSGHGPGRRSGVPGGRRRDQPAGCDRRLGAGETAGVRPLHRAVPHRRLSVRAAVSGLERRSLRHVRTTSTENSEKTAGKDAKGFAAHGFRAGRR
jgi:uncharacterized membrane protein YraQ (UPF0718 family)